MCVCDNLSKCDAISGGGTRTAGHITLTAKRTGMWNCAFSRMALAYRKHSCESCRQISPQALV